MINMKNFDILLESVKNASNIDTKLRMRVYGYLINLPHANLKYNSKEEYAKDLLNSEINGKIDFSYVINFFTWGQTLEGSSYWSDIHNEYLKKLIPIYRNKTIKIL